jgi:alanine racemase
MPESYFTMAQAGSALVGVDPLADTSYSLNLQPVMAWKTAVAQVKSLPGAKRIALIPVGYADGFRTSKGSPAEILVKGRRVPVTSKPEANCSMIYVPPLTEIQVGDEVVLLGRQGSGEIKISDIARHLGVSPLEVLCSISARIPRLVG